MHVVESPLLHGDGCGRGVEKTKVVVFFEGLVLMICGGTSLHLARQFEYLGTIFLMALLASI